MGFDLETTGLFPWLGARIDLIALRNEHGTRYVLEADKYAEVELAALFDIIRSDNVLLVGHNVKFDCNFILYHYGVHLRNIFCTQIAAQILDNGRQKLLRFGLIEVIKRYLGNAYAIEKAEKKQLQASFINPLIRKNLTLIPAVRKKQIEYAGEDVEHLIELYRTLKELIASNGLDTILRLELKVLPVLSKMEVMGVSINRSGWRNLIAEWKKELLNCELKLDAEASKLLNGKRTNWKFDSNIRLRTTVSTDLFGSTTTSALPSELAVNYGSSSQLIQLWKEFGEEPPKDGEGKYSVGEDSVETYLTEQSDTRLATFIELLLEFREIYKLVSTYGESFLDQLDRNDRIHTSYTQTRTETGRLSSKEPNLQNIPAGKEPSRDVRRFFIARPGHKLITCDMAGAEVAIAADYSKEPLLLNALKEGADMHSQLASASFSIIFKQPIEITKSKQTITIDGYTYVLGELRDEHKRVTFAKFYKAGAKRVYQTLAKYINRHHPSSDRMGVAKSVSDELDNRMPELSRYLSNLIEQAQTTGELVSDKLGRRRYFSNGVYGEAANYPIQGTNANALKIALVKIDQYLDSLGCGTLLMNIHDEVVVEAPEDRAEEISVNIRKIMADSLSYFLTDIKGDASVSISNHWKK